MAIRYLKTHAALEGRLSAEDAEGTLKLADLALRQAKAEGPSSVRYYNGAMQDRARERAELVADLRAALTQ